MLKGGCYCGAVRYETDSVPFDASLCHCSDCRRITASPMTAWFSVPTETLRIVAGVPKQFRSSARAVRTFCSDCGTPLTYRAIATPETTDVELASLDEPETVTPLDQVFVKERIAWMQDAATLPAYPGSRRSKDD